MKALEEMNLVDDFLMNSLAGHKVYGEAASRYILRNYSAMQELACKEKRGSLLTKRSLSASSYMAFSHNE